LLSPQSLGSEIALLRHNYTSLLVFFRVAPPSPPASPLMGNCNWSAINYLPSDRFRFPSWGPSMGPMSDRSKRCPLTSHMLWAWRSQIPALAKIYSLRLA